MTVIDLRNIFADRNIELVSVNPSYIYYIEEKNNNGQNDLFLIEYNRSTRRERLITNYTLDDPAFIEHTFVFEDTVVLVLENGSNSLWLIEIDKKDGTERSRRKVVCTGSFKDCMALDNQHILIYMAPDEEYSEVFAKYKEVTGCDYLCYIYNLSTNTKTVVHSALVASIGTGGIRVMNVHGQKYAVLLEPYGDEALKEHYYREKRWINADIRDNLWLCNLEELENELESGSDSITKKSIASADIKALVRYMGIDGDKIYFRAKEFRNGTEKICSYDAFVSTIAVEASLLTDDSKKTVYIIDEKPFRLFSVIPSETEAKVKGIMKSEAEFEYDSSLGTLLSCMDNRYAVIEKQPAYADQKPILCLYDSKLRKYEEYNCNYRVCGETVVLY